MSKSLSRFIIAAFLRQARRCYYCNFLMWVDDLDSFAQAHSMSARAAGWLQCTAEHLRAKCEGGTDTPENIVAACRLCNMRRHSGRRIAPAPEAYRRRVMLRIARRGWHSAEVFQLAFVREPAQGW